MKKFDVLYKRTKTGAIQYWKIEVRDGLDCAQILKESGQLSTESPLRHVELVLEGKQKRSIYEQAVFQAESDWKKKRDEGYKSLTDLHIDIVQVSANRYIYSFPVSATHRDFPVSSSTFNDNGLEVALEMCLPQFNTDANGNVKPMLAKTVDWKKVKYPCFLQPKLDGVRCLMVVKGGDDVQFLSRSGKEYTTLKHIALDVMQFIVNYDNSTSENQNFILDGEIYSDELTFQEIVAAVKKSRPDTLKLKFRAYDIINDEDQKSRWARTVELVDAIESPYIWAVTTYTINDQAEIKLCHDEWVQSGYEGAMIRHFDGKYGQGQRSSDLLKVKEFDETEFKLITFEKGQRNEDLIAVCFHGEQEFRAKMVGTKKHKEELWNDGHILSGRQLTVKHFGWTDDGLPRFPIGKSFRDYE